PARNPVVGPHRYDHWRQGPGWGDGGRVLNARSAARIAWTAAAVSAALGIGGLFFDWLGGLGMSSPVSSAYPMVWALSISLIGALVVSRHTRNAVGWVITIVGLLIIMSFAWSVYAAFA